MKWLLCTRRETCSEKKKTHPTMILSTRRKLSVIEAPNESTMSKHMPKTELADEIYIIAGNIAWIW